MFTLPMNTLTFDPGCAEEVLTPESIMRHPLPRPSSADPSLRLDDLTSRLRTGGLRLTPGRLAMLSTLLLQTAPVTLAQLQAAIPHRVALATLFRSMLRLEEIELVTRTIDLHGTANWELNVGRPRAFHLARRDTGQDELLDSVTAEPLRQLLSRLEQTLRARGYTHVQLSVTFRGANHAPHLAHNPPVPRRCVA